MAAKKKQTKEQTSVEIEEIQAQLAEAQETLRAIREGEVDAVIVSGTRGEQVFSLVGAESIYRLIVETMKEAAFTVAFDGKILFCNAQFSEFIKRPMEQILGHSLRDFVDPANRAAADALLTVAQEQPIKQRLVFADADGGLVPAHISAHILNQPDELSICVVATDLTELENSTQMIQQLRRQHEALQAANEELAATEEELKVQNEELLTSRVELNQSRARYQDLFETAPDGYISTDAEGIIQKANREAARMFGCAAADLKGNPFSALLPMSEREGYFNLLAHMNSGEKQPPEWELELRPSRGTPFWASVAAAASRDEEGAIVGLRWLIRDVTERRSAEQELQCAKDELERRVIERTEELAVRADQLRSLAGELTLAEQRERKRLAKVLHDHIQQLLVAAKFRVILLGRGESDSIKKAAKETEGMIDECIAASRSLTAELSPYVLHETGLNAGLEWLSRWMADKQGFAVNLDLDAIDPLPDIIKILLFESVRELLFNAVKHSHTNSARIDLRSANGLLQLVVSDQGIGFDPSVKVATSYVFGGGYGLFSIRERLELIGGQFEIDSAPGKGCRFVLSVPITQSSASGSVLKESAGLSEKH